MTGGLLVIWQECVEGVTRTDSMTKQIKDRNQYRTIIKQYKSLMIKPTSKGRSIIFIVAWLRLHVELPVLKNFFFLFVLYKMKIPKLLPIPGVVAQAHPLFTKVLFFFFFHAISKR